MVLKAAVSVAVPAFAFSRLDAAAVWRAVAAADPTAWFLACAVHTARPVFAALRWRILLRQVSEDRFTYFDLLKLYWIAGFFNSFLPTTVGGDVVRVWGLFDSSTERRRALWTILVERLLGAAALCAFAILGMFLLRGVKGEGAAMFPRVFPLVLAVSSAVAVGLPALMAPLGRRTPFSSLLHRVARLFGLDEGERPGLGLGPGLAAFLLSAAYQGAGILAVCLLGVAVGDDSPGALYLLAVPVAWLAGLAPVSLNGLGVREGVFVWVASAAGMPGEAAAGISVLWLSLLVVSGLMGWGFWISEGRDGKAREIAL
jgi:hypothetical protein